MLEPDFGIDQPGIEKGPDFEIPGVNINGDIKWKV